LALCAAFDWVSALKSVLLPTFGSPTMPASMGWAPRARVPGGSAS
jgi:hypothetical protein